MPSDTQVIYSMVRVGRIYPPNKQVLRDISLGFYYGAKIGVLGLNGSGKSTLLRIMAGKDPDYIGEIAISKGYSVGMLDQEPQLDESKTVLDVIREGVQPIVDLLAEYDRVNEGFSDPDADFDKLIAEQARLTDALEHVDAWNLESNLKLAMGALNCPPGDTPIRVLSGGEKRRVALTRLLLTEPDILLLDEPTNHLDAESVAWLERHLQNYKGTVIAVTHDRYFLDNVAGWILELDRGYGIPWKGNYSSWLAQKEERLRVEEKTETKRQRTLQRELEWIHMSPKARQSKGQARVTAYEKLLSQEYEKERKDLEIYIPSGPRLGNVVIELEGVNKGYGDRQLIEDLSISVPPGSIVGVIGPNGAGKSTLIKMIAGLETPDSGTIRLGETVKLAYADQSRTLDGDLTVFQAITGGADNLQLGDMTVNGRAYCASFNFTGSDQQKTVSHLSGGERNRVFLARTLTAGANVLLLDEPTNDLDVNTLRSLEEALENFAGCAVVVSHDRWFLDRISTHILALGHEGKPRLFLGNWSDFEADQIARFGLDKVGFGRAAYRGLTRN
ncbi:MAG TPA: energy-dependent translational throttle protein EttA [Anaerolineaceae bacterium]|jgi:ATP-binding cassette ChvD family protein|nr:energy-dependent translational throttle protein EttA [Anaerolineales bacterium]HOG59633.1 energy-dependent translational throttle protein EttA [Anaerolineaceae bacterium]HOR84810.1 energy-dependent translational throttle protein EttA [Anaerolineaceae bacterium]HPL43118.1 energy-dependent translational throttle protein EttA [Anaerolineaceae bacterium]HPY33723.1 energy-dependent translational throttle protein EttA [Anaerolineaceae bacterium]